MTPEFPAVLTPGIPGRACGTVRSWWSVGTPVPCATMCSGRTRTTMMEAVVGRCSSTHGLSTASHREALWSVSSGLIAKIINNNPCRDQSNTVTLKVLQGHFTKLYCITVSLPEKKRQIALSSISGGTQAVTGFPNGGSTCQWYDECRRRSIPETTTSLYISRRLKCLSKVRWRSAMEATMRQNTQTKL